MNNNIILLLHVCDEIQELCGFTIINQVTKENRNLFNKFALFQAHRRFGIEGYLKASGK